MIKKQQHSVKMALWSESRPEKCLNIDYSLCISHVVLLCNHGALLVHHHHGVGKRHSASQQTIQAKEKKKREKP